MHQKQLYTCECGECGHTHMAIGAQVIVALLAGEVAAGVQHFAIDGQHRTASITLLPLQLAQGGSTHSCEVVT